MSRVYTCSGVATFGSAALAICSAAASTHVEENHAYWNVLLVGGSSVLHPTVVKKKLQINSKLSTRFQNLYTYIFIYAIQGGPEEFAVKVSTEIGHVPASIWPPEIERPRPQQGQHITWAMLTGWWWLEPWNFMTFHFIYGMSSFPTDELIFFRGVGIPPTS